MSSTEDLLVTFQELPRQPSWLAGRGGSERSGGISFYNGARGSRPPHIPSELVGTGRRRSSPSPSKARAENPTQYIVNDGAADQSARDRSSSTRHSSSPADQRRSILFQVSGLAAHTDRTVSTLRHGWKLGLLCKVRGTVPSTSRQATDGSLVRRSRQTPHSTCMLHTHPIVVSRGN